MGIRINDRTKGILCMISAAFFFTAPYLKSAEEFYPGS